MSENVTWIQGQFSPLVSLFDTVLPLMMRSVTAAGRWLYQSACMRLSQVALIAVRRYEYEDRGQRMNGSGGKMKGNPKIVLKNGSVFEIKQKKKTNLLLD